MLTPELTGYTNLRLMELVASFFHHYADVVARLGMHALKLHDIEPAQDYTLFCSDVYIIRLNVKPGLQAQNASGRSAFVLDDARVVTLETYSVLSSRIAEGWKKGDPITSEMHARLHDTRRQLSDEHASLHASAAKMGHYGAFFLVVEVVGNLSAPRFFTIKSRAKCKPFAGWKLALREIIALGKGSKGVPLLLSEEVMSRLEK